MKGETIAGDNRIGLPLTKRLFGWTGLTPRELLIAMAGIVIIMATFTGMGWWTESRYEKVVSDSLLAVLENKQQSLDLWANNEKHVARTLAQDHNVVTATRTLLAIPPSRRGLLASPAQQQLRDLFRGFLKGGNLRGFFIIGPSNVNLASSRDANVATNNLLLSQPDVLEKLWRGETVFSRVLLSDVPLPEQVPVETGTRDMTMFVGTPIRDAKGRVIALLTLRIDPNKTLFPILLRGELGNSGETYIFNLHGVMLSPSRFTDGLVKEGLLEPGQTSVLNLRLDDRSKALNRVGTERPLTRMATSAIQGQQGIDVFGYPDYRGIPVVGAWLWDQELGVGLASEQDEAEAYRTFRLMRNLLIGAAMIAIATLSFVAYSIGHGRRLLRETRNRLAAVVASATDSIIVIDQRGRIESVNPATERAFGYAPQALVDKNVSMLMPPPYMAEHDGYLARYMATGEARIIGIGREVQARRADGSIFPAELTVNKLELDSGLHFAGVIRDISQRKQAEAALRRATEELRMMSRIATETNNGVLVTDLDQRIKWINPGFTAISGYSLEELIGRRPSALLQGPETDREASSRIGAAIGRYERVEGELLNYHKNGSPYWVHLEISPVRNEAGEVVEFIALEVDVTERRQSAEKLLKAKEEAELANRAKSVFLATMSHEIRTPLNGVVGTIELLQHSSLNSRQQELVRTAKDASMALITIINDVLDFSKIEAGRIELERIPLSLDDVVEGVAETLQPLASKLGVKLLVHCDPVTPELLGDPVRLRQIILNLAGNAIKFTGNRPGRECLVKIDATADTLAAGQARVQVCVLDTGIGIDSVALQRLFQPFVQAEGSTTRRFGGSGLGLVISRRLAETMGGDIRVESVVGEGSVFTATLVLDVAPGAERGGTAELQGLRVLVVKGDPHAVPILEGYIRHAGAAVEIVDAAATLSRFDELRASDTDVVILIDSQGDELASKHLYDALRAQADDVAARLLVLTWGRRRRLRPLGEGYGMTLDLNAMRRRTLINAVAVLAGIESPQIAMQDRAVELTAAPPSIDVAAAAGQLILLADDNETNQLVIRQQLGALGYAAEIASDGKQALSMWRSGRYALLLTDCHMPEMDGYELTRSIRAEEGDAKRIPIIAITADTMREAALNCSAAGMDDYLTKPAQLAQLRTVLEKWLPLPSAEVGGTALNQDAGRTARPEPSAQPVVDPDALSAILGIRDPGGLTQFYEEFLRAASETVTQMQAAQAARDSGTLGKLAHKLKSSARTVGANALADCCQRVEQAAKVDDGQEIILQMERFIPLYQQVEEWIYNFVSTHARDD